MQDKALFLPDVEEQYKSVYIEATKERLIKEIYDEIKMEILDEAIKDAEHTINEKAGIKRIDEFKKIMIEGFIVAIFVGLFVNQSTDFIGFFKGSVVLGSIWPTIFLAMLFFAICICIFGWLFISELIKLLKKG